MLSEKIRYLKFKFNAFKVKCSHMKLMKDYLKILKFCIQHMNKICVPTSEKENEAMKILLSAYDETLAELNECVDVYRRSATTYKSNFGGQ